MSITNKPPRTIHLGGPITEVNTRHASTALTPGMLIEPTTPGLYRKHASGTGHASPIFALEQGEMNKGIDDDYAAGDLVHAGYLQNGSTAYALLASGENVADGALLESNGDGYLKAGSTAGEVVARAIEAVNNSAGPGAARIRVEAV